MIPDILGLVANKLFSGAGRGSRQWCGPVYHALLELTDYCSQGNGSMVWRRDGLGPFRLPSQLVFG